MLIGRRDALRRIRLARDRVGVVRTTCDAAAAAAAAGVPAQRIGRTGGDAMRIAVDGAPAIDVPVAEAEADLVDRTAVLRATA